MNTVLQKACDELSKETPNIAYVRGMLDTLLSISAEPEQTKVFGMPLKLDQTMSPGSSKLESSSTMDEASILDARARAAIEATKKLSEIGQEA